MNPKHCLVPGVTNITIMFLTWLFLTFPCLFFEEVCEDHKDKVKQYQMTAQNILHLENLEDIKIQIHKSNRTRTFVHISI